MGKPVAHKLIETHLADVDMRSGAEIALHIATPRYYRTRRPATMQRYSKTA